MMDVVIRKAFLFSRFLLALLLMLLVDPVVAGVIIFDGAVGIGITILEVVLKQGFVVVDLFNLPTSTDSREWKMMINMKTTIQSHDTTNDLNKTQSAGNAYNDIALATMKSVQANIKYTMKYCLL